MAKEFLDYYSSNLSFLRKSSAEFASEFPKIASRLDISGLECLDPFVERLLEGTAFLSARVEKKLDDGYPRFLESILYSVSPDVLAPKPAFTVVRVSDSDLASLNGVVKKVSVNTEFKKVIGKGLSTVVFSNYWQTDIVPVLVDKASILTHDINVSRISALGTHSALELSLSTVQGATFDSIDISSLDFFINLNDQDASYICECLCEKLESVYLKKSDGSYEKLSGIEFDFTAFCEETVLFDKHIDSIRGTTIIKDFMCYPDLFKFIRLKGLDKNNFGDSVNRLSLLFIFKIEDSFSEHSFSKESFLLNCIPLLNMYKVRSNRLTLNQNYELNVVIDNTAPLDNEICYINSLEFYNNSNQYLFSASPFFTTGVEGDMTKYRNYFSLHRRARQSGIDGNKRTHYNKSEVFVSIAGEDFEKHAGEEMLVSANCYATNADLPMFLSQKDSFSLSQLNGIHDLRVVTPILKPRAPYVQNCGEDEFVKMSFIMQNVCTILNNGSQACLDNLKHLISQFSVRSADETERLVNSLTAVEIKDKVFRYTSKGCIYFENGFNVALSFDPKKLQGVGLYTFSRVIVRVLQYYSPVNTPVKADILTSDGGLVYSCKISND
ncbi:MAG: type VI secretion system baseplate subunit TssF [Succinivibrio sp.]|jgi:type VI secretion system VasI/ImpG family protein|nr:type VI secretion system baseplate subunit TssF [Succinivibrio sp.]